MVTELLCLALFNALVIVGINKATYYEQIKTKITDKMILWRLRYWAVNRFGEFWSKPLFTCPPCMASVHSTYIFWAFMPFELTSLLIYIVYIPLLAGVTAIVNNYS